MDPYSALIKWGGLAVGVLAILGLAFYQGMEFTQTRWDAAVAQQQLRTGEFIVKQGTETVRASKVHQQQIRDLSDANRRLTQKVRHYETSGAPQCELSLEFESTFDALSRMRHPAADGVSAAADPTGVGYATVPPPLTDAAVLPAYQGAVAQLHACSDQLNTLIEWEENSKKIAARGAGH